MNKKIAQQLYEEFHTPIHVRAHCAKVAGVAVELANKISDAGEDLDIELIEFTALIHDLVRYVDFRTFEPETFEPRPSEEDIQFWIEMREKYKGVHHADALVKVLKGRGYDKSLEIGRKHRYACIIDPSCRPETLEEKIVYYADKRVKHDQIVDLEERFRDGRERYDISSKESIEFASKAEAAVKLLEKELFALADIDNF